MFNRKISFLVPIIFLFLLSFLGCGSPKAQPKEEKKEEVKVQKKIKPVYYCPFCGARIERLQPITRSSLVVKVENSPAARPQSGLSKACVIYEFPVEGFITRFNVIYLHNDVDAVGPVRSARLPDLEILNQYQGALVFSGASRKVMARLKTSHFLLIDHGRHSFLFWRSRYRKRPHNLYTSTHKVRDYLKKKGYEREVNYQGFLFKEDSPETTPTASKLGVDFSTASRARFTYEAKTNSYLRYQSEKPSVDAVTGNKLRAKNVIFYFAPLSWSGLKDRKGSNTPDFDLSGKGKALIFQDGRIIKAQWVFRRGTPLFLDEKGKEVYLNKGLTWVEIIPSNRKISWFYK